ncbi:hypothetical protein LWI29_016185 [Acer saccharum]|uniref:Uncharacterized protein n=1 Tax=Acer saccharum TaxID=4024 RepID=A0AA39SNY2_ACESA|nr:hypothetical protein LWI29_016185 [Acer saccharum]
MLSLEPFSEDQGRSAVQPVRDPANQLPCALRVHGARHTVRAASHDRGDDVSKGILPGLGPPPQSASVHTPSRSVDRLVTVPHPTEGPGVTGLSPSPVPLSKGLWLGPQLRTLLQTTIRTPKALDSQAGLFPVRSPLLGESW